MSNNIKLKLQVSKKRNIASMEEYNQAKQYFVILSTVNK
jgi:hypothetical protein